MVGFLGLVSKVHSELHSDGAEYNGVTPAQLKSLVKLMPKEEYQRRTARWWIQWLKFESNHLKDPDICQSILVQASELRTCSLTAFHLTSLLMSLDLEKQIDGAMYWLVCLETKMNMDWKHTLISDSKALIHGADADQQSVLDSLVNRVDRSHGLDSNSMDKLTERSMTLYHRLRDTLRVIPELTLSVDQHLDHSRNKTTE